MNRKARKALMDSIEKWEQIARGEMIDDGTDNCSLCHEFYDRECSGCPVSIATGHRLCERTPYILFTKASSDRIDEVELFARTQMAKEDMSEDEIEYALDEMLQQVADTPMLRALAMAEATFLRSLLP